MRNLNHFKILGSVKISSFFSIFKILIFKVVEGCFSKLLIFLRSLRLFADLQLWHFSKKFVRFFRFFWRFLRISQRSFRFRSAILNMTLSSLKISIFINILRFFSRLPGFLWKVLKFWNFVQEFLRLLFFNIFRKILRLHSSKCYICLS